MMNARSRASDLRRLYPEFLILLGDARNDLISVSGQSAILPEISDAITRLRLGTFGYCEECDELIPLERLRKFPYARLCVPCQVSRNRSVQRGRPQNGAV